MTVSVILDLPGIGQMSIPASHIFIPGQHLEGSCLSCTIHPQQSKTLTFLDTKRNPVHRRVPLTLTWVHLTWENVMLSIRLPQLHFITPFLLLLLFLLDAGLLKLFGGQRMKNIFLIGAVNLGLKTQP